MSVRAADPRRMQAGDAVAVLSLGVDGTVASVTREGDAWRVTLASGGVLQSAGEAWRFVHPDGRVDDLPPDDVLHHSARPAPAKAPKRSSGVPTVLKLLVVAMITAMFAVVCGPPLVLGFACYGLVRATPVEKARAEVTPGEPARLELEVAEGQVLAVWLDMTVQATHDDWALDGTLTIDDVTFPLTLAPGRAPTPGLSEDWADGLSEELEPGGPVLSDPVLLGAIPPGPSRTVRTELVLRSRGVDVRSLRLLLKD